LFDPMMLSEVPHDARYYAIALRDDVLAEEQSLLRAESFSAKEVSQ